MWIFLLNEIYTSNYNNHKLDLWFLTGIFLLRHSIELGLKTLIIRVSESNPEIQNTFETYGHNVDGLFSVYLTKNEKYLLYEENEWLKSYLASIEEDDAKSDMFRFHLNPSF